MFQKYIAFIFFINIQYKFHVIDSLMHFITSIYLQKLFIIFFCIIIHPQCWFYF